MNINISSGYINYRSQEVNDIKKLLLIGPGLSSYKVREIIQPSSIDQALSLYGPSSDLYKAYSLLIDLGVSTKNIYTANCFAQSDYIKLMNDIIHYDFDYLIPIGIYLSDKFYNPLTDKDEYYISYFLEQLSTIDSLTTILATERHASLYEDFDSYLLDMLNKETEFMNYYNGNDFLENYGNNLNFIYSNLTDIEYGNVVLGALYCIRDYSKYLNNINGVYTVYDIDNIDTINSRAMYFKYNFYMDNVTVENTYNFKSTNDIYSNALIDDVIKRTIKNTDMSYKYKGKIFNRYVATEIESDLNKKLKQLKGDLFKQFKIDDIKFIKTEPSAGYMVIKYSIVPFGTLEVINIIMGVV